MEHRYAPYGHHRTGFDRRYNYDRSIGYDPARRGVRMTCGSHPPSIYKSLITELGES